MINCHAGVIHLKDGSSIIYEVANNKKLSDFIRSFVGKVTFDIKNTCQLSYTFQDGTSTSRELNLFRMKIQSQ